MASMVPRLSLLPLLAMLVASGCAPTLPGRVALVTSVPVADGVLDTPPSRLELRFSDAVLPGQSSAEVLDERGGRLSGDATVDPADAAVLVTAVQPALGPGRYAVRWHAVSARERQPLDGAYDFTIAAGAPSYPRLQLDRGQADAREAVDVAGTGFAPSAPVALTVADDDEPLATVSTDGSGAFDTQVQVPDDVPFGQQPISARDATGGKASTALDVRWGGWPPLRVFTTGTPGPGRGEVTFTVSGRNRSDYVLEGIRVFLLVPPGATPVSASPGSWMDGDDVVWDAGSVDRTAIAPRTVTLRVTGPVQTRARVEFRHRRPRGCVGDACLPSFVDETVSQSSVVDPGQ